MKTILLTLLLASSYSAASIYPSVYDCLDGMANSLLCEHSVEAAQEATLDRAIDSALLFAQNGDPADLENSRKDLEMYEWTITLEQEDPSIFDY
jgi:hypothetical protein